jgi:hypothetical protein
VQLLLYLHFQVFVNHITLTKDIFLNLALAFGFGFGFDKVFEAWQKSLFQNLSASYIVSLLLDIEYA